MARYTVLGDISEITVADAAWHTLTHGVASHVRLEADAAFVFAHGSSANGGFSAAADTPYLLDLTGLQVNAPSGGGAVTFKVQFVLEV